MVSQRTTNLKIAETIGLHYINVATWCNRSLKSLPTLCEIEAATPEKLQEEIKKILSDEQRPDAPHGDEMKFSILASVL